MAWITPIHGVLIKDKNLLGSSLGKNGSEIIPWVKKIIVANLEINHICNLNCPYCYINRRENYEKELSLEQLKGILTQIVDSKIKLISFTGKEPLFNDNGIELLNFLDNMKKQRGGFEYGFVTNGYNLEKYFQKLSELDISWIELSIDHLTKSKKNFRNLEGVINRSNDFKMKLDITSVLSSQKTYELPELSEALERIGIGSHIISPVVDEDQRSIISHEKFKDLFAQYKNKKFNNIEIYFIVADASSTNWIKQNYELTPKFNLIPNQDMFKVDGNPNFNVIFHNPERFIKIAYDGYLLEGRYAMKEDYKEFSIGNLKDKRLCNLLEEQNLIN